jgi:hypothetical protein
MPYVIGEWLPPAYPFLISLAITFLFQQNTFVHLSRPDSETS